jgi:hypothetical protein
MGRFLTHSARSFTPEEGRENHGIFLPFSLCLSSFSWSFFFPPVSYVLVKFSVRSSPKNISLGDLFREWKVSWEWNRTTPNIDILITPWCLLLLIVWTNSTTIQNPFAGYKNIYIYWASECWGLLWPKIRRRKKKYNKAIVDKMSSACSFYAPNLSMNRPHLSPYDYTSQRFINQPQ